MAKSKSSNLTTEVKPSSSVGNQQVSISLKIGNVDASDLLVVDPTALDDIKNDLDAEVTKQVSSAKSEILQEVATNDEAHKQEIQQLGTTLSSSIGTKVENAKNELSSQNSSSIASGLESAKRELQSNVQNAVDLKVTDQVTIAKEEIKQEAEQSINTKVQDAKRELESSTSQLVTQEVNASKTEIKQEISASTEQSIQTAKTELNRSIAENTNKIGDLSATGLPAEKQGNIGLGLQYLKEKYEEVKSTHDQHTQEVNAKIEELSNKVEQNSNPIKYVGILSETKDNIEAKGPDKGTWLDSQISVLNSKLKPADGMILETSDHYVYARKGGGWVLHTDKPVDLATNDTAGIVQGKDVEGSGYIKIDASGNMKLVDYQTLKDGIDGKGRDIADLDAKLDKKTGDFSSLNLNGSDNGKPVSVVEITNAILGIIGDLSNITGSQPSTIVDALNGIIASKEQINQTIAELMPKSGGTFTGKVAMDTSIMSYGDNELIPLKELKRIVGDFSTVDVNTKSTVTEVLKSLRTLITDNTNSLNNKLNASGGVLTGKITSDGNQSGFVDNDYVPLKEIKRLLGDYESLSVSNHGSVTEVLQSLLNLINTNTSSIRGNSDRIGDLSTTGLDAQHQSTVAAGIKNLKDTLSALDGRESSHNSNITSRLDSMDERINANSTQVRFVGDLTVDKDTVQSKGGSKDSWLDSQVPVLKPGQTAMDGDFVNTTDGHAYYRKGTTWVLRLNNPIVPGNNSTAGIIKGKDEVGHGYIKSTGLGDGTFELVDYQDIIDAIRNRLESSSFEEYKREMSGKLGDLTNINLTGAHATVVESFNTIIDLIGSVSSITGVTNTSVVTAIKDLVTNLENVKNTAEQSLPKSGGEITGKITCENSLNNFTGRELVPAEYVNNKVNEEIKKSLNSIFNGKMEVFKRGERIEGLDEIFYAENGPYFRIPSVCITDKGTIYLVTDCRDKPLDQTRICIVAARSIDGGANWEKKIIMDRDLTTSGYDETTSRVMDPTILYSGNETILVLAGKWISGDTNWCLSGGDSRTAWTSAAMCTINDSNWSSGNFQVDYNFRPTTNEPAGLQGFLGGVDKGIVTTSGAYVFPVQVIDSTGHRSTLLYKESNGDWTWATNFTTTTNSGECSITEVEPDVLEMIIRRDSGKKRYKIFNLGRDPFVDLGRPSIPGDQNDQGSFIHFTTKSGAKIDLITNAQNESGIDFVRDQITLYYFDRYSNNKSFNAIRVFEYEKAGSPTDSSGSNFTGTQFGGYSSIAYSNVPNKDGEMLLVAVEDDVGISLYNATDLLPGLENCYFSNLEKYSHNIYPKNCSGFLDTRRFGNYVPLISSNGESADGLEIYGRYKLNGVIDPAKLCQSDIIDGGIHLNPGTSSCAVRGYIGSRTGETVSITFTFHIPTQTGQASYVPIIRFFDDVEEQSNTHIMGGIEVRNNGEIYVTRAANVSISSSVIGNYEYDRTYNAVMEISGTTVSLYFDGKLAGTCTVNANYIDYVKSARFFCLGNPGASSKSLDIHIGNVGFYDRALTYYEKSSFHYANGTSIRDSVVREQELNDSIRKLKLQTSPLPRVWSIAVNMTNNTFRTGRTINGDKDDIFSTIPGNVQELPLILDGQTTSPVTTLGVKKTSGYTNGERAYNPNQGFWWIPRDPKLTWFDVSSFNINSTDGFTVEISFDYDVIQGQWTSPFVMTNNDSITNKTDSSYKDANNIRLEVTDQSDLKMMIYSMANNNYNPQNADVGSIVWNGSPSRVNVVITVKGTTIQAYRDYVQTYTGTLTFDFGLLKYLMFSRGGSSSITFANMKVYKLRVWKEALSEEDVKTLGCASKLQDL